MAHYDHISGIKWKIGRLEGIKDKHLTCRLVVIPDLPSEYTQVIQTIGDLRNKLRFVTSGALNRWHGFLARMSYARAIQESNTMEGINATFDEALAAVDDEAPLNPEDENTRALWGYRDAMNYIIQLSKDKPPHKHNLGTLNSFHFMIMKYDLSKSPGRIRTGPVHVSNTASGSTVYEGPDASLVPKLMDELVEFMNSQRLQRTYPSRDGAFEHDHDSPLQGW